jgi:RNA polymerase sigma factor (sigma-70 family)
MFKNTANIESGNADENHELLLDFSRNNNKTSFNKFVKNHEKWLHNIVRRFVNDKDDEEDICQAVWLRALDTADEYDPAKSDLKGWIYSRFVKGQLLHYYRDAKKNNAKFVNNRIVNGEEVIDLIDALPSDIIDPELDFDRYEKNWVLRKALKRLNDDYQSVVILHNFGNRQLNEIADMMNQKHATIRTWHRRAKDELQKTLSKFF